MSYCQTRTSADSTIPLWTLMRFLSPEGCCKGVAANVRLEDTWRYFKYWLYNEKDERKLRSLEFSPMEWLIVWMSIVGHHSMMRHYAHQLRCWCVFLHATSSNFARMVWRFYLALILGTVVKFRFWCFRYGNHHSSAFELHRHIVSPCFT